MTRCPPWKHCPVHALADAHRADHTIHHQVVLAAENARLLEPHRTSGEEMQLLFAAPRPDFTAHRLATLHRHLMD